MKQSLAKLGYDTQIGTPGEFAAFIRNEMEQNAELVRFAELQPD